MRSAITFCPHRIVPAARLLLCSRQVDRRRYRLRQFPEAVGAQGRSLARKRRLSKIYRHDHQERMLRIPAFPQDTHENQAGDSRLRGLEAADQPPFVGKCRDRKPPVLERHGADHHGRARKLPSLTREIFIDSRFRFLSHKEISEKYNLPVRRVKWEITKTLDVLKVALKDYMPAWILLACILGNKPDL